MGDRSDEENFLNEGMLLMRISRGNVHENCECDRSRIVNGGSQ